jgi:hypothetical protein
MEAINIWSQKGGKKESEHEIINCIPRIIHILWEKQNKTYLKQNRIS